MLKKKIGIIFDFFFRVEENKSGVLRSFLYSSILIYGVSSSLSLQNIKKENIVNLNNNLVVKELTNKDIDKKYLDRELDKIEIKRMFESGEIKQDYLSDLTIYDKKTYKDYLLGKLDLKESLDIDTLLEKFLEKHNDLLLIENEKVSKDTAKSVLLYFLSGVNEKLFSHLNDTELIIKKSIVLLNTIAELETGSYNFDHRKFSPTKALGRFQMVSSTLAPMSIKLMLKDNLDLNEISLDFNAKDYKENLKQYVSDIKEGYSDSYKEEWNNEKEKDNYEDLVGYTKRLNSYTLKSFTMYSHMDKDGIKAKDYSDILFKNENNKIDKEKQFEFSMKIIEFIKKPVNQGIMSLSVLDELMETKIKSNVIYKTDLEGLIYSVLKNYNNDRRIINFKNQDMMFCDKYAIEGLEIFNKIENGNNKELYSLNQNDITILPIKNSIKISMLK